MHNNIIMSTCIIIAGGLALSQPSSGYIDRLQREKVPVLVCLTFADKFYAEYMSEDGQYPAKAEMEFRLHDQLTVSGYDKM